MYPPPKQNTETQNIIESTSSPIEEITVSVIIPCYNAENTINDCIDSILSQSETGIEIIAVNDGSSDATLTILRKYETENPGVVRVINQSNQGVSAARNAGIAAAKGNYIAFVDADDTIVDNSLSPILKKVYSEPDHMPDIVYCGFLTQRRNGGTMQSAISPRPTQNIDYAFLAGLDALQLGTPCGKLYRRETLIRSKVTFDQSMPMFEDLHFNIRYAESISTFMVTDDPLYIYHRNYDSATARFHGETYMDCLKKVSNEYIPFVVKHNIDEQSVRRRLSYMCLMGIYSIYRSKRTHKKYSWLKRYCAAISEIDPKWSERLDSGIPKISGILIRRSKRLCHLWLSTIFGLEKLKKGMSRKRNA